MEEDGIDQTRLRRRTSALRRGRQSIAGARYFVTFATDGRALWLKSEEAIAAAHSICAEMVHERSVAMLTAAIMPDHVHLLFELGGRLTLDRTIAKWRTSVRRAIEGLRWQPNFFEHRLRADEQSEDYAYYLFMNPYRAGLIGNDKAWAGWWTDGSVRYEFLSRARVGPCPQPEWLNRKPEKDQSVSVGE